MRLGTNAKAAQFSFPRITFEEYGLQLEFNNLGQPIGAPIPNWKSLAHPGRELIEGRFCRLEPLHPERHGRSLFDANALDGAGGNWTYLPYGPFNSFASYRDWLAEFAECSDPLFFAIVDKVVGTAVGVASYLRIDSNNGSIEVGHLNFSPLLQRKPAATEAMYLMMKTAFCLGYRRYEWKCNALNTPSRRAAQRLGFSFEGVFRQAAVTKGRNRDTAWYSVIDQEWPLLQGAFQQWLAEENFDEQEKQKKSLSELTAPLLNRRG